MIIVDQILAWISSLGGKFFTDIGLRFVAWKTILITIVTVTVPAVFKKLLDWFGQGVMDTVGGIDFGGASSAVIQMTGLMGYLADQLMVPECIGIIVAGCIIRFKLKMIPFF